MKPHIAIADVTGNEFTALVSPGMQGPNGVDLTLEVMAEYSAGSPGDWYTPEDPSGVSVTGVSVIGQVSKKARRVPSAKWPKLLGDLTELEQDLMREFEERQRDYALDV